MDQIVKFSLNTQVSKALHIKHSKYLLWSGVHLVRRVVNKGSDLQTIWKGDIFTPIVSFVLVLGRSPYDINPMYLMRMWYILKIPHSHTFQPIL